MSQFDIMNDTVEEICKSLVEEPHKWEFNRFTFKHKRAKVEYLGCTGSQSITTIWNGSSQNQVFSDEQGRKIAAAYKKARQLQGGADQQRVISAMNKLKANKKRWWIF